MENTSTYTDRVLDIVSTMYMYTEGHLVTLRLNNSRGLQQLLRLVINQPELSPILVKELEKLSVRLYNRCDHTAHNEIKDRFSDNDSFIH